jgi:hypothetical protein
MAQRRPISRRFAVKIEAKLNVAKPLPSITPTNTPTISLSPSVTPSITATPSETPSITPTISLTPSITPSETPSVTVTPSETPSVTVTPSVTPSITATPSETPSVTPSETPSVTLTPSITPSETPSVTATPSVTNTPSLTVTPSETPSVTATPSETPSVTATPSETPSVTPSVTATPSETPSVTATPSETPSVTATPSETPSVTPTISFTPSVTPTISETPSVTPTISISPSETPSVSVTPSVTPTIPNRYDVQINLSQQSLTSGKLFKIWYSLDNGATWTLRSSSSTTGLPICGGGFGAYTISNIAEGNNVSIALTTGLDQDISFGVGSGCTDFSTYCGRATFYTLNNLQANTTVIVSMGISAGDLVTCVPPSNSPTPTPTVTSSVTATPSVTPSITPTITPSITPSPGVINVTIEGAVDSTLPVGNYSVWYATSDTYDGTSPFPLGLTWTSLNNNVVLPQCNGTVVVGDIPTIFATTKTIYIQIRDLANTTLYAIKTGLLPSFDPCTFATGIIYTSSLIAGAGPATSLKLVVVNDIAYPPIAPPVNP